MGKILITHINLFFFCICFSFTVSVSAQGTKYVSFIMMNHEIKHTMEEHSRQRTMSAKQNQNTASETTNKKRWTKYKDVKEKVQKRLHIISFALQAIPTGYKLKQDAELIRKLQTALYYELVDAPYALKNVFQSQLTFVNELYMTSRFIVGIVSSYGSINQMEKAERQILLNFALDEVKRLKSDCYTMLMLVRNIKDKFNLKRAQISYQIERDKTMVNDILNNIKNF